MSEFSEGQGRVLSEQELQKHINMFEHMSPQLRRGDVDVYDALASWIKQEKRIL